MTEKKKPKKVTPRPLMLSVNEVAEQLSVSIRTVWRMVEEKRLPEPIRYSRKLVRWRMSDLQKYVQGLRK